jgi:hypothetical protein
MFQLVQVAIIGIIKASKGISILSTTKDLSGIALYATYSML